jgi:cell division protein FtsI (penicillin-binding protein 3)
VLSPQTAADLRHILEAVVAVPGATGTAAAVDGYRVAGKSGTGKLVVDGRYAEGDVATFVGMAPAEDPRFVVAVVAHTPAGGGGEVAAPAFQEMMSFALTHYRVPPSATGAPTFNLYG